MCSVLCVHVGGVCVYEGGGGRVCVRWEGGGGGGGESRVKSCRLGFTGDSHLLQ